MKRSHRWNRRRPLILDDREKKWAHTLQTFIACVPEFSAVFEIEDGSLQFRSEISEAEIGDVLDRVDREFSRKVRR